MAPPTPPRTAAAIAVAVWLPLAAGLLVGWVADKSLLGALALLAEPLVAVAAVHTLLVLLSGRRWLLSLAWTVGALGGIASLHLPPTPLPPSSERPDWTSPLRDCATQPEPVSAPVRLVQWSLGQDEPLEQSSLDAIAAQADVVLLHGTPSPMPGSILAQAMQGEARYYPPQAAGEGGMTLVVRGIFADCGQDEDAWSLPLPAAAGHSARAVVTFPKVTRAGVFPLVAVRLDRAHGPGSWSNWPARLHTSGQRLAAVTQAIDPSRVVLAGDFGVPPSFRHLAGQLQGAGLTELPIPPTWPARLGAVPVPAVHRLDRVWAGRSWSVQAGRSLALPSRHRVPVSITLLPEVMTAR